MKGGGWEWSARASEFNLLWALLENWCSRPGVLEAAGLGAAGQDANVVSSGIFDLIEYTIELGRP